MQTGYLSVFKLRERGWTDSGIRRFLGECDLTKPNPRYKSAAPMRLYSVERVEKAEASDEWKTWKLGSIKRSSAQLATAESKRQELLSQMQSIEISITGDLTKHMRKACEHYNQRKKERDEYDCDFDSVTPDDSNMEFLNRITVNYLRHCCSKYEQTLEDNFGKIGKGEAYFIIKDRVLQAIGRTYPSLKAECERQTNKMHQLRNLPTDYAYSQVGSMPAI